MNYPSRCAFLLRLSFCAALMPAFVVAQTSDKVFADDSASDGAFDEIIVVANYLPTPQQLVGSSISVIDTDTFSARTLFDPAALFRTLPSLNVSQTGPFGGLTEIRLRGSESNHTLVLIDGVEANDIANGSTFNLSQLAATDIKRIEVLRGPQSARYGSETIGGVIAIYTQDEDLGEQQSNITLGVESGNRDFYQGSLGARVQRPVGDAMWGNQFGVTRAITDGSNASFFGSENDGYRNRSWHLSSALDWQDGQQLGISFRQTNSDADGDPQDFAFPSTATQGLVIDGDERNVIRQQLAAIRAKVVTGAWQHSLTLSRNDNKTRFRVDGLDNSGLEGTLEKADWAASRRYNAGTVEHAVTVGLQYEERQFRNISAGTPSANHEAQDRQRSQFVEYLLQGDTQALSISLRHDNNERFANLTTWRITASRIINEQLRVHSSWGEGSANPTFFELFGFIPDSFAGNANLEPEQSKGWDIGLNGSGCQNRCQWDLTYFRSRLQNEITTVYEAPQFLATPVNVDGTSRREGWELSLGSRVTQSLDVDANFTWLDSDDAAGLEEVRRPSRSGSINAHLGFADRRGKASLSVVHNGRMQDSEFIYATPETRATLNAVTLLNAGISFALSDGTTVFARGQNLLDKKYQQVLGYRAAGVTASIGIMATLH